MTHHGSQSERLLRSRRDEEREPEGDGVVTRSFANPPPLSAPHLGRRLPDAVPPTEPATTRRRSIAMETERNRVTPQLDGMSLLVSRTPPIARSRSTTLGRQRCPPVLPSSLCVLVSAPILHRHVPLAIPTNKIGKTRATTVEGFHPHPGN